MFFNKYVHELVTIDTDFIDARFNNETPSHFFLYSELLSYVSDLSAFNKANQNNVSETQIKVCLISCLKYQPADFMSWLVA